VVITNEDNVLRMIAPDRVPAALPCMAIQSAQVQSVKVREEQSDVARRSDIQSLFGLNYLLSPATHG